MISASQRTQGNKGRKGISLKQQSTSKKQESKAVHSGGQGGQLPPQKFSELHFFIVQYISQSTPEVIEISKLTNNLYFMPNDVTA